MEHRISAEERAAFRGCRRQWDFGSPNRQGLVSRARPRASGVEAAVRAALAVYYFPGVWDWPRDVVLGLVAKELERHQAGHEARGEVSSARRLVEEYTRWAATADPFAPVIVDADLRLPVPDPSRPGQTLAVGANQPVMYTGRADVLVVDRFDAYWVVPFHRRASARASEPEAPRIEVQTGPGIRRTWIRRSAEELTGAAAALGAEAEAMVDPKVAVYPSSRAAPLARSLAPCLAIEQGRSFDPLLAWWYSRRDPLGTSGPEPGQVGVGAAGGPAAVPLGRGLQAVFPGVTT